ncbi:hypothetical protein GQ53DRAFT_836508 [Thozetella sp. PMI_491]|nr:hypothetical protein GQ53DRAFT_836508 [Thozetella sp. PMI_491]
MADPAASLPAPRQVLTSLITRIASIPLLPEPAPGARVPIWTAEAHQSSNTLARVPEEHRHLIITLHVLFPGQVLPALDLLDRGLVTKLIVEPLGPGRKDPRSGGPKREKEGPEDDHMEEEDGEVPAREGTSSPLFLVWSTAHANSHPRRKRGGGASTSTPAANQAYHVRLDAWNCSCAGFAYSSFPATSTEQRSGSAVSTARPVGRVATERQVEVEAGWSFGGMSLDGTATGPGGDNVPLCKHFLACLLAERWREALGQYVHERRVTREEMAGYVAEL